MVASLNFGLLQPLDLSGAVQAFDVARSRGIQQQNADTQQAQVAAQIAKQQADADNEMKRKAALKQGARALIFGDLGAAATPGGGFGGDVARTRAGEFDGVPTVQDMPSAPAAAPTAPMQAAPVSAPAMTPAAPVAPAGEAVAEPMATVSAPRVNPIWDQLIDADPEQAIALFEKSQKMTADERKRVSDSYGMLAAATVDLTKIPYEQRRAALEQMAPMLEAQGVPRNLIEGFDPTDQNLAGAANNALGLKEVFAIRDRAADNARADAQFAETRRSNAVTEGQRAQRIGLQADSNAISAAGVGRAARKTETDLRKEFNSLPEIKEWREIGTSYRQIYGQIGGDKAKTATAQNDIAAVFSYMKMLDPGSVVREGEFANAQNAAGIPDQVRNLYNRAVSGNRLNPEQRNAMLLSAADVVRSRQARVEGVANQFRGYANDYGVSADRVAKLDRVFAEKPGGASGGTPRVKTEADWRALKPGTVYLTPDGKRKVKQ